MKYYFSIFNFQISYITYKNLIYFIIDIIKKSDNPVVYLLYGQIAVYLALAFFTTWFSSPATWFWLIITGMIYCYVGYDKK